MVTQDAPPVVGPGVTVLGRLTDDELARAYREAWVFCLPSEYEGFGIPYAEAMASGTPVVATPNVGSVYVSDGGRAARVVTEAQLGSTVATLLTDAATREDLARLGLRRAREFSLASVVDRYETLYQGADGA
jgi:glycosyltransferase involved in cell wall biosynthesis